MRTMAICIVQDDGIIQNVVDIGRFIYIMDVPITNCTFRHVYLAITEYYTIKYFKANLSF